MFKITPLRIAICALLAMALISFSNHAAQSRMAGTMTRTVLRAPDGTVVIKYYDGVSRCFEREGYPTTFHCLN